MFHNYNLLYSLTGVKLKVTQTIKW
jgi:hypothetical protein